MRARVAMEWKWKDGLRGRKWRWNLGVEWYFIAINLNVRDTLSVLDKRVEEWTFCFTQLKRHHSFSTLKLLAVLGPVLAISCALKIKPYSLLKNKCEMIEVNVGVWQRGFLAFFDIEVDFCLNRGVWLIMRSTYIEA